MNKKDTIDLNAIVKQLWQRRKLFFKVWGITFVVASLIIISVPRTYKSEMKLAPELDNGSMGGALGSVAESFGFDIGSMATSDAISPELYPDLLETNDFIVPLFSIPVETHDGKLRTTYFNYLWKHQKIAWWNYPMRWLKSMLPKSDEPKRKARSANGEPLDSIRHLNKVQNNIASRIKGSIKCSIDRKTSLITVVVTDQDPEICATVADSIRLRLQQFIIKYRTQKASIDVEYYENLQKKARAEYEEAARRYANFFDGNTGATMQSVRLRLEMLQNDKDIKEQILTTVTGQLQQAKSKLQQRTPAFTTLESAAVPLRASGPKRMLFVLAMLMLATAATAVNILRKNYGKTE